LPELSVTGFPGRPLIVTPLNGCPPKVTVPLAVKIAAFTVSVTVAVAVV